MDSFPDFYTVPSLRAKGWVRGAVGGYSLTMM